MRPFLTIEKCDDGRLALLMNEAFEGYFVHFEFSAESLRTRMDFDGVDPVRSKILEVDGVDAGLALVASRGDRSRVATMGIIPSFRGKGLGRDLLRQLTDESERLGERDMILEVIQQNEAAVALYESEGFEVLRDLVGFSIESPVGQADTDLVQITVGELARSVAEEGDPELPWQLSAPSLARLRLPTRCFRLGPARVALADPQADDIRILSLVCDRAERRKAAARSLLGALFARYPGRRWSVPAVCPPGSASAFFEAMSFGMLELKQYEMIRPRRDRERESESAGRE